MPNQHVYDHTSLATNFARILRILADQPRHSLRDTKEMLVEIFPWLSGYDVRQDGNDLRWLAVNGDPDLDVVFPHVRLAEKQVRDWIDYAGSASGDDDHG